MINDQYCIYTVHFFLVFFQICKHGSRNEKVAQFHVARTITTIGGEYRSQNHREQKLAARQPFRFHRPSHCILFLFCANNRWALSSPAVSLLRFSSTGRCHSTLFASVLLFVRERSHSYPATQSSFSCASAAIEPLIKEPIEGFLLAR